MRLRLDRQLTKTEWVVLLVYLTDDVIGSQEQTLSDDLRQMLSGTAYHPGSFPTALYDSRP